MSTDDDRLAMAREYAAARFTEQGDRDLIGAAFRAGWDAREQIAANVPALSALIDGDPWHLCGGEPPGDPVYRAAAEGEPFEDFPHTLDGMRAAMDAAVLLGERTSQLAACLSVEDGTARPIRVYDPAARAWTAVLGGEQS